MHDETVIHSLREIESSTGSDKAHRFLTPSTTYSLHTKYSRVKRKMFFHSRDRKSVV
jgi:hypothetical protein